MMFWFSSSVAFIALALSNYQAKAFLCPLRPITGNKPGTREQVRVYTGSVWKSQSTRYGFGNTKSLIVCSAQNDQEALNQLLATLTERGIGFRPDATRLELEDLLRSSTVTSDAPLDQLLKELDRRNIRYAPSATRRDLEQLLTEPGLDFVAEDSDKSPATPHRRQSQKGTRLPCSKQLRSAGPSHDDDSFSNIELGGLLAELDKRGIRFAPTATRSELETLLLNSSPKDDRLQDFKFKVLGAELDRRGIQYTDAASLSEQESLVKSGHGQEIAYNELSSQKDNYVGQLDNQEGLSDNEPGLSQPARRLQRRRNRQSQRREMAIDRILEPTQDLPRRISETIQSTPVSKGLRNVQKKIAIEAGRATGRVVDFLEDLEYESREGGDDDEPPLQVEVVQPRRHRDPRHGRRLTRPPRRDGDSRPLRQAHPDNGSIPIPDIENTEGNQAHMEVGQGIFAEREHDARLAAQPPPRRRRPPPITRNRRIYSPIETPNNQDVIDKVGNFVADAAESVLPEREGDETGHWKERLSNKFDQALGYGDRLMELPKRDYIRPYQPPLSQLRRPKGSILSVLLGGPPRPGQNQNEPTASLESLFGRRSGTTGVTSLLGTGIRGAASFVGYLCQWASVRGVVPQPVVAFLLLGTTLSARRNRIWTFLGTLLVTRIVGETFHNSLYGPDGEEEWEVGNELRDVSESRDWNDKLHPDNRMQPPAPRSARRRPSDLENRHDESGSRGFDDGEFPGNS